MGSTVSNSLSYDMFCKGYYIAAFDLSTAQDGANDLYSIPTVMTGKTLFTFGILLCNIINSVCARKQKTEHGTSRFRLIKLPDNQFCLLGNLRVRMRFNCAPEKDFSILMFSESTVSMEITKSGKLEFSYVPK